MAYRDARARKPAAPPGRRLAAAPPPGRRLCGPRNSCDSVRAMARMGASTRSVNDGLSRGLFRAAFVGARRNSSQSWKKPLWQIRTRLRCHRLYSCARWMPDVSTSNGKHAKVWAWLVRLQDLEVPGTAAAIFLTAAFSRLRGDKLGILRTGVGDAQGGACDPACHGLDPGPGPGLGHDLPYRAGD